MRPNHLLWLAVLLLPVVPVVRMDDARSVRPVEREAGEAPRFEPSQSAALFVGIRKFTHDSDLTQVRFAVDDAVDLAHASPSMAASLSSGRIVSFSHCLVRPRKKNRRGDLRN